MSTLILKECKKALELIKDGSWHQAHDIVEQYDLTIACQIHAHLHRIEGDLWNAEYWYRQAGFKKPNISVDEEWTMLINKVDDALNLDAAST